MRLAKYWAKGEIERLNTNPATGAKEPFFCWGWSNEGLEQARDNGRQRAIAVAALIDAGERPDRYTYGDTPLREPATREWTGADGVIHAAITTNSYGCEVLNTSEVMFVDVDLAPGPGAPAQMAAAIAKLDGALAAAGGYGARIYRTAGGLRYIVLAPEPVVPADPRAAAFMQVVGADPLYVTLCRVQECYRARLTPKPWRCGCDPLTERFPWTTPAQVARVQAWQARYRKAAAGYIVCNYLGHHGAAVDYSGRVAELVELHDHVTCAIRGGGALA